MQRTERKVKQAIHNWINRRKIVVFDEKMYNNKDIGRRDGKLEMLKELESDLEGM